MSEHKKQPPVPNGIVTSGVVRRPQSRLRWLWLLAAGLLLVAVAAVSVILMYRHYGAKPAASPSNDTNTTAKNTQTIQEQMTAAITAAQQELAAAKTAADKASAYKDLGMAYFNNGQYDQAVAAYNNAISTDASIKSQVLDTLAYVYATAGQRDKAIATYQELITLLQQQSNDGHNARVYEGADPNAAAVQTYQHDIQVLQQGGSL